MVEFAPHSESEENKRRSTRIVQAVPLTVTGVDALGRPFQERTSTLFINCHGCRYQSKHYVLKNMWVTLEVPHPETGREPRSVRGRVTWIQRPRTVRELFQVGVELEVPGNVWGIAFPPPDWFAFPEGQAIEIRAAADAAPPADQSEEEWQLPATATITTQTSPQDVAALEDNVRVMPGPASMEAAALTLARQVARLVVEAEQQIQSAVREAASATVAAETRPILAGLQNQLREAAERSVEAAMAAHTEEVMRETLAKIEGSRTAGLETLRESWTGELQRHIQDSGAKLAAHLTRIGRAHQSTFEQNLQNQANALQARLNDLISELGSRSQGAEASVERFTAEIDKATEAAALRWKEMVAGRAAESHGQLEELAKSARRLKDDIAAATAAAQSGWRGRLDADLAAATTRWNEKVETSLEGAARQAAERLARNAQTATDKIEQHLTLRAAALRESFDQAAGEAQSTLDGLRGALVKETSRAQTSLGEIQQAVGRMGEFSASLEAMGQATAQKLQQHFEEILATESAELSRRASATVAGMAERLQPVLESSGQQTLKRLAAQLEEQFGPHLERAGKLLKELTSGQGQAEETLRLQGERLSEAAEKTLKESAALLQDSVAKFEKELQEAGRAATSKWLAELDAKATDTTHTTFEALFKSAEWYEKRVQTQMQGTLEKGLEQAAGGLREKAGEISGLFAAELDHYCRSYVEQAQSQMEDGVKDLVERGREQVAQVSDTAAAAFGDDAHRLAQREFERFSTSVQHSLQQNAERIETQAAQVRTKMDADSRQFFADFQKGMTEQVQQGVTTARQDLLAETLVIKEGWRAERESEESQLKENLGRLSSDSIEEYKKRLENVSNSWLLTTVTRLGQQSQDLIATLTTNTEERLRQTCTEVFAGVGETLRQRLQDLSQSLSSPPPPKRK